MAVTRLDQLIMLSEHENRVHQKSRFHLEDAIKQYAPQRKAPQNLKEMVKQERPKTFEHLSRFFQKERVEDISRIEGRNIVNYELKIVWKALTINLKVTANSYGLIIFRFTIPNKIGIDRLIFKRDMTDAFGILISKPNIYFTFRCVKVEKNQFSHEQCD